MGRTHAVDLHLRQHCRDVCLGAQHLLQARGGDVALCGGGQRGGGCQIIPQPLQRRLGSGGLRETKRGFATGQFSRVSLGTTRLPTTHYGLAGVSIAPFGGSLRDNNAVVESA